MRKRLLILSDLWGRRHSKWVATYSAALDRDFDITYYDCCELGQINIAEYQEESLHKEFVAGGIDRAVEALIGLEKNKVHILAFSIGGTIAWRFGIETNRINSLICMSSTRLRYETERPKGEIELYYGAEDIFKPKNAWFDKMKLNYKIIKGKEHQMYIEDREQLSIDVAEALAKISR
ncbi:alpha/beta hydrolase family protein [Aquimarina pacifica]|uniref:alpha/beta hydrolase n=1 Tax=Aquimarina pacifica TaxID=1296415 RepID=UPI000472A87D|nr:alpha/beta hydrolase [Aquimarina pacifica]